ncbi:MAG: VWA domain-containing protein [Gallicola sp.]|nr:VWA domain-containing protein [Gallicola sp.]
MRKSYLFSLFVIFTLLFIIPGCSRNNNANNQNTSSHSVLGGGGETLRILSGSENRELEGLIDSYAKEKNISIEMTYLGSIDIMRALQSETSDYDAVWPASSIWISMGDKSHRVKHTESTTITPVVFGIRKSLAEELGFVGKEVSINDIMKPIQEGKLKFSMTSATQSNSGASAYLGFLSGFSGNPEVLNAEHLQKPELQSNIENLLSGVERSSGSSEWLKTMFLAGNYDAMVNYESLIITTNNELIKEGKEPLYVVYPYDGLSISDSPLGFIDQGNQKTEEIFLAFQEFLTTEQSQDQMQKLGRRTGFQGVFKENEPVFNQDWGVDTKRILSPIKTPSADTLMQALNLYQTDFRKPSLSIYCLDFSGSMSGEGEKQVKEAMDLLLNQDRAQEVLLQANEKEVNHVIFFDDGILGQETAPDGSRENLKLLNEQIQSQEIGGGTNMYNAVNHGLEQLKQYDLSQYTPAIIILSDGASMNDFDAFAKQYDAFGKDIPVFSILFGEAEESQLKEIAEYTNARVFDGREDLVHAFRSVKGYN